MYHIKAAFIFAIVFVTGNTGSSVLNNDKSVDESSCICTMEYLPLCASDNRTYSNPCLLGCGQEKNPGLQQACDHECPCEVAVSGTSVEPQHKTCFCPKIYSPLCASNGITYDNQCILECAQEDNPDITLVRQGRC